MSEPLLSQEELDALAQGVSDGSIVTDGGLNTEATVSPYDLATGLSTTTINIKAIDLLMERMVRQLRQGLQKALRSDATLSTSPSILMPYIEFITPLQAPVSINIMRFAPLRGLSLVVIEPDIIFAALDQFFGGPGRVFKQLPEGRLFTATEQRIIKKMLDVLSECLREAWSPVVQLQCEVVGSEVQPEFAQITDSKDLVLVTPLKIQVAETESTIHLVYPLESLKPIRESLQQRIVAGDGEEEMHRKWLADLTDSVDHVPLEVRATLSDIQITLKEFNQLKEGDTLWFKRPKSAMVEIADIPLFAAEMGASDGQAAVKIKHALSGDNALRRK